jgi:cellulose synthase/poly-beta-1,6-N-acetylglucosamine synthase-like glycosyltransferase
MHEDGPSPYVGAVTFVCPMIATILHDILTPGLFMILFWVMVSALLVMIWYWLWFYTRVYRHKPNAILDDLPEVSVVICARNEDDNLVNFLPLVLQQDYPKYEVVVVNDCSLDNTEDILKEFAAKYPFLKIVTIKEDEYYQHGKKVAVMMGIKGAANEHIILTDADCQPASDQWLKRMVAGFTPGKEIVLGYGAYFRNAGLLNKLIRFDTAIIALQYLGFALAGRPYMGVGRNLAYTKTLFFKNKGFASHYHIESGDDDLFVNETATASNVSVETDLTAVTYSESKAEWKGWWRQKKRHLQTGHRYKAYHKVLLGWYAIQQWLFFAGATTLLIVQFQPYVVLGVIGFRVLFQMIILSVGLKKLGEKDLIPFIPLFELFFMIFYPVITIARKLQRKRKWN